MDELTNYRRLLIKGYQEAGNEIKSLAERMSAENADLTQDGKGWCARQVASHMRDVEGGYFLPYIERIMAGKKAELDVYEVVEKWGGEENKGEQPGEIISDLIDSHMQLTTMLGRMSKKDWNSAGRHLRSGKHTVQWYLEQNLAHLTEHIKGLAGNQ